MTDRYAIFGNPVGHSKSPHIYLTFARQHGVDLSYEKIEAPLGGFAEAFQSWRASGAKGGNITAPFKLDAYAAATKRMLRAELAGAVNCYKFEGDEIVVENFDGIGLVNDIQQNLKVSLAGKRVLMLGAGGAVRGAVLPFLEAGPASFALANRTLGKAQELASRFAPYGHVEALPMDGLAGRAFDVVLNATSASQTGALPTAPGSMFAPGALAYELVYGKGLTPFLKQAQAHGVSHVADGVGMLVEQAAEAFLWWRGIRPDTTGLIKDMTVKLV